MSQEEFIQSVAESLSESEEIRVSGEAKLNNFINDPNTIKICFEILMTNPIERNQKFAAIYAHIVIKKFWISLGEPIRHEIQMMAMQILSSREFSIEITDNFLDSITYIYSHDETCWPGLIEFMQSINGSLLCLMIAKKIIPEMLTEVIENLKDFFLTLSISAMTSNDFKMQMLGVATLHMYVVRYNENPGIDLHVPIFQILANSQQFNSTDMTTIWSCFSDLSALDCIPEEIYPQIIDIAFSIGQNRELEPITRYIPIEALNPIIDTFSEEILMKLFTISIDITASMIEIDGSIDDSTLDYFDTASSIFDHQTLYPIIQNRIQDAFSSNSFSHQISGLLIFKFLLKKFPDLIYHDIEYVVNFLMNALSSPQELLKEAALRVIESFTQSFKSTNVYSPNFVPLIFPILLSPSPETRHHAYSALYSIFIHIDKNIPGILQQFLQISALVQPDNIISYLSLLALVIESAGDFSDEDCDQIIALINNIIQTGDIENIVVCFEIAVALLHQDETQLDYVIQTLFPFIGQFLQADSATVINQVFDFIGNLSDILRENSFELFQPYVPAIINILDNTNITNEVKTGIVINVAKFAKFSGQFVPEIIPVLIPNIINGLKSEEDEFQTQSARAIRKIKKFLDPQTSQLLFKALIDCLKEASSYSDHIDEVFLSSSKLLIIADQSNVSTFIELTIQFIQTVFNNTWILLSGKPLIQYPEVSSILPPLCTLFSAIVHYNTPINDQICQFLIQWIQKNNEIDLPDIVGTLSDCLEYKNISEPMLQTILSSINQIMENATEPTLLQNLTFLMNMLVQDEKASNLLPNIIQLIPIFEKWRQIVDNSKFGYQDVGANIASLYLQIAIRYPEFHDNLIIYSILQFPPFDFNETASMASAIMNLLNAKQNPEIVEQAAMAFTRFFIQEELKIEKAKVPKELKGSMLAFLKQVCSQNNQIFSKITASYGKQKSKIRKIQALINS